MPKKKKVVKKLKGKKAEAMMMSDKEMQAMKKKDMMSGNRPGKVSHYRKS